MIDRQVQEGLVMETDSEGLQIKLEAAAREYCRLAGIDPDKEVWTAHQEHSTLATRKPMWQIILPDIRRHILMSEAVIKAGLIPPQSPRRDER